MWTCPHCASQNAAQWRARLISGINKLGGAWTWFTLTAHRWKRGAGKSIANLRAAWDTLMKRMKRRFGKFAYVRVYEQHKDGSYHIHAIAQFHFGDICVRHQRDGKDVRYSAWLAEQAEEMKIGYYTHADDIASDKHAGYVASYVAKYMTKMSFRFKDDIGRVRRIQASQNFPKLPETGEEWEFKQIFTLDDALAASRAKKRVVDVASGEIVGASYWTENVLMWPIEANEAWRVHTKDNRHSV